MAGREQPQRGAGGDPIEDPPRLLALAVLERALRDLEPSWWRGRTPNAWRERRDDAWAWLTGEGDGLCFWCGLAGVEPEAVRAAALAAARALALAGKE